VTYAPAIIVLAVLTGIDWFGAEPKDFSFEHLYLGNIHLRSGNSAAAEREFRTSLKLLESPDAMVFLSHVLIGRGEIDETIDILRRCLEIAPDAAQAHNNLASCLSAKALLPEALEHLNEAVKLEPYSAMYRLNRAVALIGLGRLDDAAEDIDQVSKLPTDAAEFALLRLLRSRLKASD
jgi:tetratricopeptide (TPR) repeat protein